MEVSIRGFNKDLYFNPDLRRCTSQNKNKFGRNRGIETHERDGCGARMVPCISESCYKTMPLYNLLEHLHEYHDNGYRVMDQPESQENGIIRILCDSTESAEDVRRQNYANLEWYVYSLPFALTKEGKCDFSNRQFISPRFVKKGGIYYMYLRVMANEAVAAKYSVDLEITTPNGLVSTKLSGVRVYSVDLPWEEVIEDRQLGRGVLAIHPYMATHYNCEEFSRAEGGRSFHTIYTVRYPC